MYIKSIRIENYKSFRDSNVIEFTQGFNVIVGENNSGKTALAMALSLRNENDYHKSPRTKPERDFTPSNQDSKVTLECDIEAEEVLQVMRMQPSSNHIVAADRQIDPTVQFKLLEERLKSNLKMAFTYYSNNIFQADFEAPLRLEVGSDYGLAIKLDENGILTFAGYSSVDRFRPNTLAYQVGIRLRKRIYAFDAERLNISQAQTHATLELKPNADNLASVLHNLMANNRPRFARYVELIRRVFPTIHDVSIPLLDDTGNRVVIQIWNTEPDTERDDLAVTLDKCGTGIGQVLAILYILVMADTPRPIIIDEPQSFLHPGAVRRLFEIMHEHPQHQYIITTHSPSAIVAAHPQNVLLVTKKGYESRVKRINLKETREAQEVLGAVGARFSDVFGVDSIIWVEGQTEEQCFPLIISKIAKRHLEGTAILAVVNTGDFDGKDQAKTLKIYHRLSTTSELIPPTLAFIFDREKRTLDHQGDIQREAKSNGIAVEFLPRKLFENYLLEPRAIAHLISSINESDGNETTSEMVEEWMLNNRSTKRYYPDRGDYEKAKNTGEWFTYIHGVKLLDDLLKAFLKDGYEYYPHKILYGGILTEWLIENQPEALQEIADLLTQILSRKVESQT
jgi:AAA15 family ATPase/GTPase